MSLSAQEIVKRLGELGLSSEAAGEDVLRSLSSGAEPVSAEQLLRELVARGQLTKFQAKEIRQGRDRDLRLGNYVILSRIGAGGMGTVYKAIHLRMKRVVAIKIIREDQLEMEHFIPRFQREMQTAARLNHPNVVAAFDADEFNHKHFLVMEFVDGADLDQIVRKSGPLNVEETLDVIRQAAQGLGYAHAHGVVHRDVKPANLMRDMNGVVKVADLGLARLERGDSALPFSASLSVSGMLAGTFDYMSPEQAADSTKIDHRADIYSLGCTLYYLLCGRPLFTGKTVADRVVAHRDQPPPSLCAVRDDVPQILDEIFQRMVAKHPGDRWGGMEEIADRLEALHKSAHDDEPVWDPSTSTILLVEPSKLQAVMIQSYLQQLGADEVFLFRTGHEAVEALSDMPVNLLITTMQLPDMTGIELAEQVRDQMRWSRTAILLMTASAIPEDAQVLLQCLPAVGVVHKPFDARQLQYAVTELMRTGGAQPRVHGMEEKSVLIVDDSSMWRLRIQKVLKELGFAKFVAADHGVQAVELLREQSFGLVVTDYHMPEMDGKELVAHIRQESTQQEVPIVLVTTEYDPIKLAEVYHLGASAICHKSMDPQMVRNIVMRLFV